MNFFKVLGRELDRIFCLRRVRLTVSKALVRSSEVTMVRRGGRGWLKPELMV